MGGEYACTRWESRTSPKARSPASMIARTSAGTSSLPRGRIRGMTPLWSRYVATASSGIGPAGAPTPSPLRGDSAPTQAVPGRSGRWLARYRFLEACPLRSHRLPKPSCPVDDVIPGTCLRCRWNPPRSSGPQGEAISIRVTVPGDFPVPAASPRRGSLPTWLAPDPAWGRPSSPGRPSPHWRRRLHRNDRYAHCPLRRISEDRRDAAGVDHQLQDCRALAQRKA
jgi:hypothetical protein